MSDTAPLSTQTEKDQKEGWQDIATAPKDGRRILGVRYFGPRTSTTALTNNVVLMFHWNEERQRWFTEMGSRIDPTHWMPMPELPEVSHG